MNRYFFRTIAAVFAAATLFFAVSCDKNKDDDESGRNQNNHNAPTSLIGTSWTMHDEYDDETESGMMAHFTTSGYINFTSADAGMLGYATECEEYPEENDSQDLNFIYTYNAPGGTISATVYSYPVTLNFTIAGDKLTAVINMDGEATTIVFTRSSK